MKVYRIHWVNLLGEECEHPMKFNDFKIVSRIADRMQKVNPAYKYRVEIE